MRVAAFVPVLLLLAVFGLAGPADALVVCSEKTSYNAIDANTVIDFRCGTHFDAFVVAADNSIDTSDLPTPAPPRQPAAFTVCMVKPTGTITLCEQACGSILKQNVPADITVRVYLTRNADPDCLTLAGSVEAIFADESA